MIGNDKIYFDDYVKDYQTIKVDLPTQNNNSLVLEHYGKYFGENKRWDTKSENGKNEIKRQKRKASRPEFALRMIRGGGLVTAMLNSEQCIVWRV